MTLLPLGHERNDAACRRLCQLAAGVVFQTWIEMEITAYRAKP
jgi:hypothetical protein